MASELMSGWYIAVFRQSEEGRGDRLAAWPDDHHGLEWLDALVTAGDARLLSGDGYPSRYAARADRVIARLAAGPPPTYAWLVDGSHGHELEWYWKIDRSVVDACRADEWLLVEAWDES